MEKDVQCKPKMNKTFGVVLGAALMVLGVLMLFNGTNTGILFVVSGGFVVFWSKSRRRQKAASKDAPGLGLMLFFMAAGAVLSIPHAALAFTTPAAGSFGYDFYNLIGGSGGIATGAIGWSAAALAAGFGIHELVKGRLWGTIAAFLAAGGLANLPAIVTTLGVIR